MSKQAVAAIIVSYNPDIKLLNDNIRALKSQASRVLVLDNCSDNKNSVLTLCKDMDAECICLNENNGLGSLNVGFYKLEDEADWILMMDQDSIISDGYIAACSRYMGIDDVGIITSRKIEASIDRELQGTLDSVENSEPYTIINRTITSGALVKVSAFKDAGGFDQDLFLDYVDFDFSVRVRHAGYKILKMNDVFFQHRLGETTLRRFLFWKVRYSKHSPSREYLIGRNIVIYIRRYWSKENVTRDFLSLCKHVLFSIIYECGSGKAAALCRGIIAGIQYEQISK